MAKVLPAGEFKAVNIPNVCVQPDLTDFTFQRVLGNEDCLYLNIYRPNADPAKTNFDVLFFIHGGAYFYGSAHPGLYGPKYMMETGNVILVTVQYRLNALGFLATGDASSPGNYALKDQVAALKFVKENIQAFGGNPESITVAGQSAGASSSHLLTLSPSSNNLMKAAIGISGNAIAIWNTPTKDPLALARNHARALNVADADTLPTDQLIAELRKLPAEDIIRSVVTMKWMALDPLTLYRPVIEPAGTADAFLTQSPLDILKGGQMAKVPILFTNVGNEGGIRSISLVNYPPQKDAFNGNMSHMIPFLMEYDAATAPADFLTQLQTRYSLTEGISGDDSIAGVQKLYTDRSFLFPAYRALQLHAKQADQQTFYVSYDYRGQYSYSDLDPTNPTKADFGVIHSDDLILLFEMPALFQAGLNEQDKAASQIYVQDILAFVKDQTVPDGTPCSAMEPMCNYVKYTKNEAGQLVRNVINDFDQDMVTFWDQLHEIDSA